MALGLLWASACDDWPATQRVGQYIDFTTEDPTKSLCVGSAVRLDRHVEQVHSFIGEPVPIGLGVPLQVVEESICPGIACYSPEDQTIYAEQLEDSSLLPGSLVEHELTHALIDRAWGDSVPSLKEGLAEALTSTEWGSVGPGTPIRSMLAQPADGIDYVELGRFVRFLVDSHGVEQFKRLYRMTRTRSQDAVEANFETVYGESFEAIEARYLSGANRCRYQLHLCDDAAEPVGSSWSETFAASCSDPDSYGSRSGEGERFATQRTVKVEVAGQYRLRASVPVLLNAGGSRFLPPVKFVRCGDCDEQRVRSVLGEDYFTLEPGIYTIYFEQIGDSAVTLEVELVDE